MDMLMPIKRKWYMLLSLGSVWKYKYKWYILLSLGSVWKFLKFEMFIRDGAWMPKKRKP